MMLVSPVALQKIREFRASDPTFAQKFFRVTVESGGCSGFQYRYDFDDRRSDDIATEVDAIIVLTDPESFSLIDGATLDFQEDFQGAGFVVVNPNATGSCGCGKSFSA